jgi:hypothetical protein
MPCCNKPRTIEFNLNPLWLLKYLKKDDEYGMHIDTLYYNIRHKTKSHKFLNAEQLEAMMVYVGFHCDKDGYYNCVFTRL